MSANLNDPPVECSLCGEFLWRLIGPDVYACRGCDALPMWARFSRPALFDFEAET